MSSPAVGLGVNPEARAQSAADLAVMAIGELRTVSENFTAEVVEGYPAAWAALTQTLGDAWPVRLRGGLNNGTRAVEVAWLFEQPTDVDTDSVEPILYPNHQQTYISSSIPLPATEHGTQLARAVSELAAPSIYRRWHYQGSILGVPGVLSDKRGRTYSRDALLSRVAEELAPLLTAVRVSGTLDSENTTYIQKEGLSHDTRLQTVAWLSRLTLSNEVYDEDAARQLVTFCEQRYAEGIDTVDALSAYIQRQRLRRLTNEKEKLSSVVEKLQDTTTRPVLTDATITVNW